MTAPRRSAGALIVSRDGSQCLLVKQKDGHKWSLPKGTCNDKETLEDCMQREVKEETGVVLHQYRHFVAGRQKWKRYVVFIVKMLEPTDTMPLNIGDAGEIDQVQWTDITHVFGLDMNRVTRDSLKRFISKSARPACQYKHFGNVCHTEGRVASACTRWSPWQALGAQ